MKAFILTMPNAASWNGKWSGEGRLYAKVRYGYETKTVKDGDYDYRWDDGWCANVEVKTVTSREAAKISKHSVGFYGYDWMIESIIKHGKILSRKEQEVLQDG